MKPIFIFFLCNLVTAILIAMPPPVGKHARAPQDVAARMHNLVVEQTGEGCTIEQAVAAFVDLPGISSALGFREGTAACDIRTGARLLSNMQESLRAHFPLRVLDFRRSGSWLKEPHLQYWPGLNASSVKSISGISSEVLKRGLAPRSK